MKIDFTWWSWKDTFAAAIYTGLAVFLFVGFLQRDTMTGLFPFNGEIANSFFVRIIALSIILFLPVFFVTVAAVYYMVRRGSWASRNVMFLAVTTLLLALVLYIPLSYVYERSLAPREPFHAHLHLFPPPIDSIPDDEDLTIAFLGGSTTAWGGWTDRVEENLRQSFPDHNVRVLNQGAPWYTTLQSLINYECNARRAKPDIVVVMHAINDLAANADHSNYVSGPFRDDYGHLYAAMSRLARTQPFIDLFFDVVSHLFYWTPREVIDTDEFRGLPAFSRYYRRLVQLVRLDGAEIVVVTQPYLYKVEMNETEQEAVYMGWANGAGPEKRWSIATARRGMEQYVEEVRKIAAEDNVTLIDLESRLPKSLDYMFDDCHYTHAGAEIVAEEITRGLEPVVRSLVNLPGKAGSVKQSKR